MHNALQLWPPVSFQYSPSQAQTKNEQATIGGITSVKSVVSA